MVDEIANIESSNAAIKKGDVDETTSSLISNVIDGGNKSFIGEVFSLVMKKGKDIIDESIENLDLEGMAKKYSVELPKICWMGYPKKL